MGHAAKTTSQAGGEGADVDHRPLAAAQRKTQSMMEGSAQAVQHKARVAMLEHGPRFVQLKAAAGRLQHSPAVAAHGALQRQQTQQTNRTGLPDALKAGVESLSGMRMDHVKVHYNSSAPAQLQAHAFAQGSEIHVAPGQEQHLPHEAWHVVQQAQQRIKPTLQLKGAAINDDVGMEAEADAMGARALRLGTAPPSVASATPAPALQLSAAHNADLVAINLQLAQAARGASAQQAAAIQREAVLQLQAGRFLVEDGEPAAEGQISKSQFLADMKEQVAAVSRRILAPFGMAQADCPDLAYWVGHYESKDVTHVEQVIARYAPDTATAENAQQYLAKLVQRIEAGLEQHTQSGAVVDPEPMPDSLDKQRPPLKVFGIQRMAMPVVQRGCGSSVGTGAAPGPAPLPLKLSLDEEAENQVQYEARKGRLAKEARLAKMAGQKRFTMADAAVATSIVDRGEAKYLSSLTKTGEEEDTNAREFNTDFTHAEQGAPVEAKMEFHTAIGNGTLLIGKVYNNAQMGDGVSMAKVLKKHLQWAEVKPETIRRVMIKNVINTSTVKYCESRFPGRTELTKKKEIEEVISNSPLLFGVSDVVPDLIKNASKITFDPGPCFGMGMQLE